MDDQFSVDLTSLLAFANELSTQIEGIAAPMDGLATQAGVQSRYGAFNEAWLLAQSQQAALEEMYGLLGQVKQAIAFAEDVTRTVASGYQQADEAVASGLGYGAGVGASSGAPATATASSASASAYQPSYTAPAAWTPPPSQASNRFYGGVQGV